MYLGVNNTKLNGFSQPASDQPPNGTWEKGVFDYDHLKKSFIPIYKRYWDNESKVPFLFNDITGIWITYDDSQSIAIKADYIKREKLAGAMFWELSTDRKCELIDVAYNVLNNNKAPSLESNPPIISVTSFIENNLTNFTSTVSSTATKTLNNKIPTWKMYKNYKFGDRVTYENKIYHCLLTHKSLPFWTPRAMAALWRLI